MSSLSGVGSYTKLQKIEIINLVSSDEEDAPVVEQEARSLQSSLELNFIEDVSSFSPRKRLIRQRDLSSINVEENRLSLKSSIELGFNDDASSSKAFERPQKKKDQISLETFRSIHPLAPTYRHAHTIIEAKDDSDEEEILPSRQQWYQTYTQKFPSMLRSIIENGLRAKLLANVYLRKVDKTANVFIPFYFVHESGMHEVKKDYFRTPKGEICIFASGGLQNIWEKTVSKVFHVFFGEKVKIIRASWIEKHLQKDLGISRDIEKEFKGRETELHSEFFYDLFFRHFFYPNLKNPQNLTIYAYSWWDVCDTCEKTLSKHREIFKNITYNIAASRRYFHHYPTGSIVAGAYVPKEREGEMWKSLWSCVLEHVRKPFEDDEQKYHFWTATKEGLEICKWLGQAFIANKISPKGYRQAPMKQGDVLYHFAQVKPEEADELNHFILYLQSVNWELSCWYKLPNLPNEIQKRWNKHWKGLVVPHFDWEEVFEHQVEKEAEGVDCEMCGYPDLHNVYLVYHPKHKVSERFLKQPLEYQQMSASNYLRTISPELPQPIRDKRKQSICVGSECIKFLILLEEEIVEWRDEHPLEEEERKFNEMCEREENNQALEKAERAERASERKRKERRNTRN